LRFALLGPLLISDRAGKPVELAGTRLRVLLAALLLNADVPVSSDALTEAVWDGNPPGGSAVTLRSYVMRLRRALGPEAGSRITAREPGYMLSLNEAALDVRHFETLGQEAAAARHSQAWAQASSSALLGLGLWRAVPLLDVPSQVLRDQFVPRLEQIHVQLQEDYAEAELRLGRHEHLLPQLSDLSVQHPLRERFRAQLMLALARTGRQAEALTAYQDARHELLDQLGVEPGPELRRLHRRILAGDPELLGPAQASGPRAGHPMESGGDVSGEPGAASWEPRDPEGDAPGFAGWHVPRPGKDAPVPHQFPAGIPHFTGRKAELDLLSAAMGEPGSPDSGTVVISAIGGMAGVGKTALAVHWAHQHAAGFPDGQLYADLRGFGPAGVPVDAAVVARRFLEALGVPAARIPADTDAQFGLYRSMLAGQRMLIILDNARDADQVRPLLPGAGGCLVLVTSRSELADLIALEGAVRLPVGLLDPKEARDLLARRLGADRVAAERAEADELAGLCARLPLALNIAAARAAARPAQTLRELAAGLRDARLDLLSAGPGHADVRAVFSWSYRALSPPGARLFRLLGLHPGPDISIPAAASLAALDHGPARLALDELAGANLLAEHVPGRYALHDLLRAYAAEQARACDSEDERRAAVRRVLDHYLLTARAAALLLVRRGRQPHPPEMSAGVTGLPLADQEQARAWCQAEQSVLLSAILLATEAGFTAHAWQLAWSIEAFPEQWRRWQDQIATGQIVLAAAGRAGDEVGQAYAHRYLGDALLLGSRPAEAYGHLQAALALSGQLGDRISQADTELSLAEALGQLGQPAEALARSRRSLEAYQAAGHDAGQATALNHIGWWHLMLGNYEQGLAACQDAIELIPCTDDLSLRFVQAATLDTIGYAHHHLGHYGDAVARYQEALHAYQSLGELKLQATILDHLGDTCLVAADPAAARDAWRQALAIFDDLSHPGAAQVRAKIRDHER
jgi:DNA-binding SARP family transcriptional activator/tetratricopeptide (TPR) repeat protein